MSLTKPRKKKDARADAPDVAPPAAATITEAIIDSNPDALDPSEEEETPPEAPAFRALHLTDPVMRAIIEAGFEAPTPIQEQAIPILLAGDDLIGQAQTGTGKTAAFALPLAERLEPTWHYPQAIVLLPTRDLCIQVAQETHS